MRNKAVVSLTTGLEDPERVNVALLVAVGAAESGRPTLMFLTKEAVRLAIEGTATGTACAGWPPLADLLERYQAASGDILVCPICLDTKGLHDALLDGATVGGTVRCGRGSATTAPPPSATDRLHHEPSIAAHRADRARRSAQHRST